jgi:hypothetical protein
MNDAIYAVQIAAMLTCIYMAWMARKAINGLSRGLILLCLLLIVRRIDDVFGILDTPATLILSSAVALVLLFDMYSIYKNREIYALYLENRKKRIDDLEAQREKAERNDHNWSK